MSIKDLNRRTLATLTSQLLDHVTCLECCKQYVRASTAGCGHSLCRGCWAGRRACPSCGRRQRASPTPHNAPLQARAAHVARLVAAFEKLFNINMQEFMVEVLDENEVEPDKTVKQWLTSSQNHFSAPVTDSQDSQAVAPIQLSSSKIQIHTSSKKSTSPTKVVHVSPPQDDWDKIEAMPDTEDIVARDKENVIGPMDLEPFLFDENEYSNDHPRRSSRKRENKKEVNEMSAHSKTSNADSEKKSTIAPQSWNNVKKMRKEFSKLNKKNKNKLNVSIEMCKKTQNSNKKATVIPPVISQLPTYTIDEATPDVIPPHENVLENQNQNDKNIAHTSESESSPNKNGLSKGTDNNLQEGIDIDNNVNEKVDVTNKIKENNPNNTLISQSKVIDKDLSQKKTSNTLMPFIKKGALCTESPRALPAEKSAGIADPAENAVNVDTDDIEISIKIGNTITNIVINKKQNDVKLKVNTDKEIQTSPPTVTAQQTTASTNSGINNLQINICGQTGLQTRVVSQDVEKSNKQLAVVKSASTKKNTASAETATAQFEITESVEREISDIMECVENEDVGVNTKGIETVKNNDKTELIPHQTQEHPNDDQLMNEDIFASGSVKELPVQALSASNSVRSEVFVTKSRTQKDKRQREVLENETTQAKKKQKRNSQNITSRNATFLDSEGMNYDAVMGKVFASIDKDIEISKSQNADKNTQLVETQILSKSIIKDVATPSIVVTQDTIVNRSSRQEVKPAVTEKFSENIFSLLERESQLPEPAPRGTNKQVPGPETQKHIEKLLTPGVCDALGSVTGDVTRDCDVTRGEDAMLATPAMDEDDHSVVEETPQKNASSGKKSKQNPDTPRSSRTQLVIDLEESESSVAKQNEPLETPLNMNKFAELVTYKSTPMARKSLVFPTDVVLAASCVSAAAAARLRTLCARRGWSFLQEYSERLTHLVVAVDAHRRAQRSVKYMRALAAGKWIVSMEWADRLLNNEDVCEEQFEALDMCGAAGPARARGRARGGAGGLLAGLSFHCAPPYSVLAASELAAMLRDAGGRVLPGPPLPPATLLLAEPGTDPHTDPDPRYTYMAMELGVVPVNFEWVLNCLGAQELLPLRPLLLLPRRLLPRAARRLPAPLLHDDSDDSDPTVADRDPTSADCDPTLADRDPTSADCDPTTADCGPNTAE